MKLIKADFDRRIDIPGVPDAVQRPVDIDKSQTGFASLRSLRIYHFEAKSVIDGHAEEDEVLIVVLSGNIELTMSEHGSENTAASFEMSAVSAGHDHVCVAYLPPNGSYRLIAPSDTLVAYARATPRSGRSPRVFSSHSRRSQEGVEVLLEEAGHAERLRLQLMQINVMGQPIDFTPVQDSEDNCEALVHVRTLSSENSNAVARTDTVTIPLESWDTLAISREEHAAIRITEGSFLVLVVLAN